jgi:hypothetical protein
MSQLLLRIGDLLTESSVIVRARRMALKARTAGLSLRTFGSELADNDCSGVSFQGRCGSIPLLIRHAARMTSS